MTQTTQPVPAHESTFLCPSRRALLVALPGVALLPALAACGSSSSDTAAGTHPAEHSGGQTSATDSAGSQVPVAQVPVAQVPVGSAVVIAGRLPYVVAQPTEGRFVAFNAACTHRGTTVSASDGLGLTCPAHGSKFDGATGAVTNGPAASPLESVPVRQDGENLVVG